MPGGDFGTDHELLVANNTSQAEEDGNPEIENRYN